jgi:hypothetical protein
MLLFGLFAGSRQAELCDLLRTEFVKNAGNLIEVWDMKELVRSAGSRRMTKRSDDFGSATVRNGQFMGTGPRAEGE